jgi:hypothetical protein
LQVKKDNFGPGPSHFDTTYEANNNAFVRKSDETITCTGKKLKITQADKLQIRDKTLIKHQNVLKKLR